MYVQIIVVCLVIFKINSTGVIYSYWMTIFWDTGVFGKGKCQLLKLILTVFLKSLRSVIADYTAGIFELVEIGNHYSIFCDPLNLQSGTKV